MKTELRVTKSRIPSDRILEDLISCLVSFKGNYKLKFYPNLRHRETKESNCCQQSTAYLLQTPGMQLKLQNRLWSALAGERNRNRTPSPHRITIICLYPIYFGGKKGKSKQTRNLPWRHLLPSVSVKHFIVYSI